MTLAFLIFCNRAFSDMKHLLRSVTLFLGCTWLSSATLFADDNALEALAKAQKALLNASVYQATTTRTLAAYPPPQVETLESVGPSLIRRRFTIGTTTRMELITDGKKEFMWESGRFVEEPGNAAEAIKGAHLLFSLDFLLRKTPDILKFLRHENLSGQQASLYLYIARESQNVQTTQIWISDTDQRPLRIESENRQKDTDAQPYAKTETVFGYDLSVSVKLPAN